jgi:endogenous inhibitor of DNA gyrase (YacG/DUF329 family)
MSAHAVKCPTCGREIKWSAESPFRPFCSERCRLIDLGAWLSEQHAIPDAAQPGTGSELPDDESSGER